MKKLTLLTILFLLGITSLNCMEEGKVSEVLQILKYREILNNWGENHQADILLGEVRDWNHRSVNLLIKAGVDVNGVAFNGDFALWVAVRNCDIEMIKILIEAGANPLQRNSDGNTILDIAINLEYTEIYNILTQNIKGHRELKALFNG